MRTLFFLSLFFTVIMNAELPQTQLAEEILERFCPLILEELEKEVKVQDNGRTLRATCEYGYSFFKMKQGDFSYRDPPQYLVELGNHVAEALGDEPPLFSNYIISYYGPGYYLKPHIDIAVEDSSDYDFYFGENVYGLILEADKEGHLYIAHKNEEEKLESIYEVNEERGTVFCLKGRYRHAPFLHGVKKVANSRISITFRSVHSPCYELEH